MEPFSAILGAIGLGISAYGMYQQAKAGRQTQALNESMSRSNIRIQTAENAANLGVLDFLLTPGKSGTSRLDESYDLARSAMELEGRSQFGQMDAVRQEAQDMVSEANVLAAARGLAGGEGTSAGAMGARYEKTLSDRTTEMAAMFGEDLTFDLTKGIFGQSYKELATQQELDRMQIESEKDILTKTQEELAGQYKDVGGRLKEDGTMMTEEEIKAQKAAEKEAKRKAWVQNSEWRGEGQ